MHHEQLQSPEGQRLLEELRRITGELPEVDEVVDGFGHATFKVRKKSFVIAGMGEDGMSVSIKSDPTTQSFLIRRGPYYRTPYIGQHGWVSVADPLSQDRVELEELIVDGYRLAAPRTLARRVPWLAPIVCLLLAVPLAAQADDPLVAPYPVADCPSCAAWNEPHRPFRVHGNTYWVGTRGLGSVLITSPDGHVLIDGGLPDSAPMILESIRALGFDPRDVKLIVNSHAHFDHAGGIAALQRATGARVAASPASAPVLESGAVGPDDPQYGLAFDMPAVPTVDVVADGDTVHAGPLSLTAHFTAGHTPGGTSWSWRSCDPDRCLDFVYADSQTPISRDGFRYTDDPVYPSAVADFVLGYAALEGLSCDVLLTPHPGASGMWDRMAAGPEGLIDGDACRRYASASRQQLVRRLEREAGEPNPGRP